MAATFISLNNPDSACVHSSIAWVSPSIPLFIQTSNSFSTTSQHYPYASVCRFVRSPVDVISAVDVPSVSTSSETLWNARETEEFLPPGILVSLLHECSSLDAAKEALSIVVQSGYESDTYVGTNLVQLYSRLNNLSEACRMFNKVEEPNVITWTSVISAHSKLGQEEQGLRLYHQMQESGIEPDGHAVVSALHVCASITALEEGMQIHDYIVESGFESNTYVGNALVSMYASCGSIEEASTAFFKVPSQDVITWSALIGGYAQQGCEQEAFELVKTMWQHGVEPNHVTYVHVLEACSNINAVLEQGMLAHACIVENGFDEDEWVGSALIDLYAKSGLLEDALKVFDKLPRRDVVTWTALITGFAQEDERLAQTSLCLYERMQIEGIQPNNVVYLSVLKACAILTDLDYGQEVHEWIVLRGWDEHVPVSNNIIDMYMKCGRAEDASHLFAKLSEQNVVTWTSLIMGHAELGNGDIALELFYQMEQDGIEPDLRSYVCVLKACSCVAALQQGMAFHRNIIKRGFELDDYVGSILIYMYSSCGNLSDAVAVFERLESRSVVIFNALITGYAKNNSFNLAVKTFNEMERCKCKPDAVTFLSLLIACSNLSLVKEGCYLSKLMRKYAILPKLDHYNTLVDIFGHAGLLHESEDLLETMPFKANTVGWVSLLSSCRSFRNMVVGRRCFERVVTIEPLNSVGYVLMSKIYSLVGEQENARRLEQLRLSLKAWKVPGRSYIEVNNEVHTFVVGGWGHPRSQEIYARLDEVFRKLKEEGPLPHLIGKPVMDKGDDSCEHSEMLAVGFGLIHTPRGKTLRIMKNLCTCVDCHSSMLFISKTEKRKIVLIDKFCVHEFKTGVCTCSSHYYRA
ncbi:hypothetical protein GOP47_0001043 [Adiantum capillus-veneris]|uniref:DYW domain-containing protein n=1 Tax=Adiantum capillus-veneris TaxID=13818 RepID=A0A9D4VF12_ADICA|nr:hypothetical protein GOP47_0001043 [Adiantum capillus-veneris]